MERGARGICVSCHQAGSTPAFHALYCSSASFILQKYNLHTAEVHPSYCRSTSFMLQKYILHSAEVHPGSHPLAHHSPRLHCTAYRRGTSKSHCTAEVHPRRIVLQKCTNVTLYCRSTSMSHGHRPVPHTRILFKWPFIPYLNPDPPSLSMSPKPRPSLMVHVPAHPPADVCPSDDCRPHHAGRVRQPDRACRLPAPGGSAVTPG